MDNQDISLDKEALFMEILKPEWDLRWIIVLGMLKESSRRQRLFVVIERPLVERPKKMI